jgi:hypothetical protein
MFRMRLTVATLIADEAYGLHVRVAKELLPPFDGVWCRILRSYLSIIGRHGHR